MQLEGRVAVVGFSNVLARGLADAGLTVNEVCPGRHPHPAVARIRRDWLTHRKKPGDATNKFWSIIRVSLGGTVRPGHRRRRGT